MSEPAKKKAAQKKPYRGGNSTRSKRTKTVAREDAPAATGRPPLAIDPELVDGMASFGASMEDVATYLEVDVSTIKRRFAPIFQKHKAGVRIKLQQAQIRTAIGRAPRVVGEGENIRVIPGLAPNPTMQIWLGKQLLGQSEKREIPVDEDGEEVEGEISTIEIFKRTIRY